MQNQKENNQGPNAGRVLLQGIRREKVTIIICLIAIFFCWYFYYDSEKILSRCNVYYQESIKQVRQANPSCSQAFTVPSYSLNLTGGFDYGQDNGTYEHTYP